MDRFVIDVERLKAPFSGLGQFCRDLATAIIDRAPDHFFEPILLVPPELKPQWSNSAKCITTAWWRRGATNQLVSLLPAWAKKWSVGKSFSRPAMWHASHHQSRYNPPAGTIPVVTTIHDLKFLHMGNRFANARKLRNVQRVIDRSSAVVTISHAVRMDIERHLNLRGKPLRVIYNAPYPTEGIPVIAPARAVESPFLFSIGYFEPKKNFESLVNMMEHLPDLHLLIAGDDSTPYGRRIHQHVENSRFKNRIRLLGTVTDAERQWLYQNCQAFVFPSLAEGFGLPVLEAMNAGKPTILAHRTSLPEVGGSLAGYWKDFEPESMAKAVREALQKVELDPTLASDFRAWAGRFSWTTTADKYLEVYRLVLDMQSATGRRRAA